ncbi:MFS transporter [Actibacterium sp. 188UL27-1]|uniref:MFS transporter n=1 Tax=Actibacterium sp. 188UL27-1 TaxID=2786961 RepID=UPI00195D5F35|nr:MFS transporter [Actibacterium sp. 188UL27-1]
MTATITPTPHRLWAYSLYAAVLSGAGLPIYIYAPKFFADTYGVSLTALGAVLFGLRLFDVVQDPVLGWLAERLGTTRKAAITAGAVLLALSMVGLFAVAPPVRPVVWFGITITGLFSAFSFLTILFYAQGVAKAGTLPGGHVQLAGWREAGALLGICVAAVAPTVLTDVVDAPFAVFAVAFAVVTAVALIGMMPEWQATQSDDPTPIGVILSDQMARRLLVLALVNAIPLAVSSTLFLFFVESRLNAPGWEGPLLLLFFLAAAISAPFWSWAAAQFGSKPILLLAMVTAILAFGFALTLGSGDVWLFAIVCVASGATIGADLVLLPALFARRMAAISPTGGQGFGLWAFVSKFTLAFAAVLLLPALEFAGFEAGADNPATALTLLTILYAGIPCALKLVAIALLLATPLNES